MLNKFRKPRKEEEQEVHDEQNVIVEEVTYEAIESGLLSRRPEPPPEAHVPALSPEEQRLRDAKAHLEAVKSQNMEGLPAQEVEEAQRKLEAAAGNLERARSEQDKRFHEANRLVLEAEADIQLAKQQKAVHEQVSGVLAGFKAAYTSEDTTLMLSMIFSALPPADQNWINLGSHSYEVQMRDTLRSLAEIPGKIASYHAYRRRIGEEK